MKKIKTLLFKDTKSSKIFWSVLVFFIAVSFLLKGWGYYDQWKEERRIDEMAQELKRLDTEYYDQKVADKIGGKTPQETLDLYINAVEKGDYELASKYFVVDKQEEELKILKNSPRKNIENILTLMKNTRDDFNRFSGNEETFSVHNPILVSFVLYPSGNWKIEKI